MSESDKLGDALQEAVQDALDKLLGSLSGAAKEEIAPLLSSMAGFVADGDEESAQVVAANILLVGEYQRLIGIETSKETVQTVIGILIKFGIAAL